MLFGALIIAFAASVAAFLLIWAPLQESIRRSSERAREEMSGHLDEMFIFIPMEHLGTVKLGAMGVFAALGFILAYNFAPPGSYVAASIAGLFGYFSPNILVWWLKRRRRKQFSEQLMDGFILLSNGLRAGFTMQQAVEMLVQQSRAPLSQEFDLVLREYRLGVDLDKALINCARRTLDPDLELATIAVSVTRQLGGNLAEIFERLVEMIKARKLLDGKVEALTAQGKTQAIVVAAMPYIFAFLTMKVNPDLMMLMWTTVPGLLCLAAVVVLDLLGYFWVLKITNVKY